MIMEWIKKLGREKKFHCALLLVLSISGIAFAATSLEKEPPLTLPDPDEKILSDTTTPGYVVIRPSDQATFSSETTASIAAINVKEGSQFIAGDILLEMDCRLQKAELQKALAQQMSAGIAETAAKKLKNYGSISQFEYIKAISDARIARAEVEKLRTVMDKCIVKAPFNGAVSELMVHAHETVKPGDPLLKIVSTENLEFEIQVPSCWLQVLHLGSIFSVHINETNQVVSAKITKINPQIEPVSESVKMTATITPPNAALLPGMSGQANFPEHPEAKCNSQRKF